MEADTPQLYDIGETEQIGYRPKITLVSKIQFQWIWSSPMDDEAHGSGAVAYRSDRPICLCPWELLGGIWQVIFFNAIKLLQYALMTDKK